MTNKITKKINNAKKQNINYHISKQKNKPNLKLLNNKINKHRN